MSAGHTHGPWGFAVWYCRAVTGRWSEDARSMLLSLSTCSGVGTVLAYGCSQLAELGRAVAWACFGFLASRIVAGPAGPRRPCSFDARPGA
jgi:hypothetical protein